MERRNITALGLVQGIGFRPFVFRLATELLLTGWVRNFTTGVEIEVQGKQAALDIFFARLTQDAPPLALIEDCAWHDRPTVESEAGFVIIESASKAAPPRYILPDLAPCEDCLREMNDPADRRYQYPFLNCTNCGPRYSIITALPYDRERTTMADFRMCPDCQAEYTEPQNRRYHAQPIACPRCGPQLSFYAENKVHQAAALDFACRWLHEGKTIAVKGNSGIHLACDASLPGAIIRLRERKQRLNKPLAIMVADLEQASKYVVLCPEAKELLNNYARPIVLLPRKSGCSLPEALAPGLNDLGIMLPSTPLHHLLLKRIGPLVMTSGNPSSEPLLTDNEEALQRLSGIADGFLLHNRRIHQPCDDSIYRFVDSERVLLRRGRGMAPVPQACNDVGPVAIGYGGEVKSSFCLLNGQDIFLSEHMGDLINQRSIERYNACLKYYQNQFSIEPQVAGYDKHPGYCASSLAKASDVPLKVPVQHHSAHMLACMAEHNLQETNSWGIVFDGTGYGNDGTIWGSEFLFGNVEAIHRWGTIIPVMLPGGEMAVKEPWRMALALCQLAGVNPMDEILWQELPSHVRDSWPVIEKMLTQKINSPHVYSMGRWFDGISGILGLCHSNSYEAEAAMRLEAAAARAAVCAKEEALPFEIISHDELQLIDFTLTIKEILKKRRQGITADALALAWHSTVARAVCQQMRQKKCLELSSKVFLSGGGMQNDVLVTFLRRELEGMGYTVYKHHRIPPNDGGIAVGQAIYARSQVK